MFMGSGRGNGQYFLRIGICLFSMAKKVRALGFSNQVSDGLDQ